MSYRVEPTENEAGRVYCASGKHFLELNDEGVISKNSETERNQFLSAAVWISVLSLL